MKEYTLTLTVQEAQMAYNALLSQPYGQVHELVAKLQAQFAEQDRPKSPAREEWLDTIPITNG